jgi:hypothetical protein
MDRNPNAPPDGLLPGLVGDRSGAVAGVAGVAGGMRRGGHGPWSSCAIFFIIRSRERIQCHLESDSRRSACQGLGGRGGGLGPCSSYRQGHTPPSPRQRRPWSVWARAVDLCVSTSRSALRFLRRHRAPARRHNTTHGIHGRDGGAGTYESARRIRLPPPTGRQWKAPWKQRMATRSNGPGSRR